MTDFQGNKALVRQLFDELDTAQGDQIDGVLSRHTAGDYPWRGVHPFNELAGAASVVERLWKPLKRSFTALQRRQRASASPEP